MTREPDKPSGEHGTVALKSESRLPVAAAILVAAGIQAFKAPWMSVLPAWVLPTAFLILLVCQVIGDPGKIDSRSRTVRVLSILLTLLVTVSGTEMVIVLVSELLGDAKNVSTASALLQAAIIVWVQNAIGFGFLYWEFDGGGPGRRAAGAPSYPSFAFPQTLAPQVAPPDWRPTFPDYLYLSFTNSAAFSPTDVMPLTVWAKALMAIQALETLVIMVLVVGRAVNVLT
jgi:hypothetical protein